MRQAANREAFFNAQGYQGFVTMRPQLRHGSDIAVVEDWREIVDRKSLFCDGIITTVPDILLAVTFADCPSVAIIDIDNGVMALLHAGWRGVAAGIIEKAINKMEMLGAVPEAMMVKIGPAIDDCCYEMDADDATKVDGLSHIGKVDVSLPNIITARLKVKGVPLSTIYQHICTSCSEAPGTTGHRYFSYRRDKITPPPVQMFTAVMKLTTKDDK